MRSGVRAKIEKAYALRRDGKIAQSLQLYRTAAIEAGNGDPVSRAHCLRHIGDLERQAGRLPLAREALEEAETLYRSVVSDPLSLANTLRLRALTENRPELWAQARAAYESAGKATGLDLRPALEECDAQLRSQSSSIPD